MEENCSTYSARARRSTEDDGGFSLGAFHFVGLRIQSTASASHRRQSQAVLANARRSSEFAFAITGAHEDVARIRPAGQVHIAVAMLQRRPSDADLWRAPEPRDPAIPSRLAGKHSRRPKCAGNSKSQRDAHPRRELPRHEFVDRVHQRLREESATDAGLIVTTMTGIRIVQSANGVRDEGKHTKTAHIIQVADLFGDGAIAIEKDRGTSGRGLGRTHLQRRKPMARGVDRGGRNSGHATMVGGAAAQKTRAAVWFFLNDGATWSDGRGADGIGGSKYCDDW